MSEAFLADPPKPQPKTFLRPREVAELESDLSVAKQQLDPGLDVLDQVSDKREVVRRAKRIQHTLDTHAPHPVEPHERDAVSAEQARLEESIRDGMPTRDEMMRNPSGAVGKNMRWNRAKKAEVMAWKALRARTQLGSDDPDACNIETLRPEHDSMPMEGAQIERKALFSAPSPQYTQNYDEIDWQQKHAELEATIESTVAAAVAKAMSAVPAVKPKRKGKPMTDEHKEKLRLGREAAKARREGRSQPAA